uniref:Uncharacterized protein n=1 Tax=Cacopsylla melanoneura TaxID=428564 RepID=A0A8D8ZM18_9HEMI
MGSPLPTVEWRVGNTSYGKETDPYRKDSYGKETEPYRKDSYGKPAADPYAQVDAYKNGYGKDADPFAKDPYAKSDPYYDEDDPYSKSYSEEAYTNDEETYYYSRNQHEDNKFEAEVTVEEIPGDKSSESLLSRRDTFKRHLQKNRQQQQHLDSPRAAIVPDSLESRDDLDIGDSFETAVSSVSTSVHNKNKQMPQVDFYPESNERRDSGSKQDYTTQNVVFGRPFPRFTGFREERLSSKDTIKSHHSDLRENKPSIVINGMDESYLDDTSDNRQPANNQKSSSSIPPGGVKSMTSPSRTSPTIVPQKSFEDDEYYDDEELGEEEEEEEVEEEEEDEKYRRGDSMDDYLDQDEPLVQDVLPKLPKVLTPEVLHGSLDEQERRTSVPKITPKERWLRAYNKIILQLNNGSVPESGRPNGHPSQTRNQRPIGLTNLLSFCGDPLYSL